jgi:hypothetical protein
MSSGLLTCLAASRAYRNPSFAGKNPPLAEKCATALSEVPYSRFVNGNAIRAGSDDMKSTNERGSVAERASNLGFPLASATLLIFFGIVFQLAELACRNIHFGNLWLLSVLASDIWNMLSMHFNVPAIGDALLYWPLVLICLGIAILLAVRENQPARAGRE